MRLLATPRTLSCPLSLLRDGRSPDAGQLKDNEQGGSSTLDKVLQPKPEIKEEATQPVDSSTAKGPVAKEHRKAGATDKAVGKSGSEAGIRQPKQKGPKGVTDRQQGRATGTKHSAGPALKQPAPKWARPRWEEGWAAWDERAEDWAAG